MTRRNPARRFYDEFHRLRPMRHRIVKPEAVSAPAPAVTRGLSEAPTSVT